MVLSTISSGDKLSFELRQKCRHKKILQCVCGFEKRMRKKGSVNGETMTFRNSGTTEELRETFLYIDSSVCWKLELPDSLMVTLV